MKFKTFIFIVSLVLVCVTSCKKSSPASVAVKPSTMSLITAKQWQFDTLYSSYSGPGTGTLQYARGGNANTVDLDDNRSIFWPDGTEDAFGYYNTNYAMLTWSFTNSDSTLIYYPANVYFSTPVYQRILKLDATHLTLYDSTGTSLDILVYKP